MTEQTPDPTPEEPPAEEPPAAEPCTSAHPHLTGITCELTVGHFDQRVPHTRHANDTVYEWE